MAEYKKAYEAVARATKLDDRAFDFLERIFSLEGLTQQMIRGMKVLNAAGEGPKENVLEIACAAKTPDIYSNLIPYLINKSILPNYDADLVSIQNRPIYKTKSGLFIPGTRKLLKFRLYNHKLDILADDFEKNRGTVKHRESEMAVYAPRTYASLLVYNGVNLDFVEAQGDFVIGIKGEKSRGNIIRMGHD